MTIKKNLVKTELQRPLVRYVHKNCTIVFSNSIHLMYTFLFHLIQQKPRSAHPLSSTYIEVSKNVSVTMQNFFWKMCHGNTDYQVTLNIVSELILMHHVPPEIAKYFSRSERLFITSILNYLALFEIKNQHLILYKIHLSHLPKL